MAIKPSPSKTQKKPAPKPAAKAAKAPVKAKASTAAKSAKPAPAKSAPKPAPKPAAKPALKAAPPKPKPATSQPKATVKPAAEKPVVHKGAKGAPKGGASAAAKATKPAVKEPPKKKLNVGQKPRSDRADLSLKPATFLTAPREADPSATAAKSSPASKEAKQTFKVSDSIVYPAHGVGRIIAVEKQHIAGIANELFVIAFDQEKLKLKVPTAKAISVGMRGLSDEAQVKKAVDLLKGRARIKRTMWSRRAQEYEAKINSGDIMAVAEVVRDLYRATDQPEQSYSERQLFEAALDRLAREVAAVRKCELAKALADLDASLQQKKAA